MNSFVYKLAFISPFILTLILVNLLWPEDLTTAINEGRVLNSLSILLAVWACISNNHNKRNKM